MDNLHSYTISNMSDKRNIIKFALYTLGCALFLIGILKFSDYGISGSTGFQWGVASLENQDINKRVFIGFICLLLSIAVGVAGRLFFSKALQDLHQARALFSDKMACLFRIQPSFNMGLFSLGLILLLSHRGPGINFIEQVFLIFAGLAVLKRFFLSPSEDQQKFVVSMFVSFFGLLMLNNFIFIASEYYISSIWFIVLLSITILFLDKLKFDFFKIAPFLGLGPFLSMASNEVSLAFNSHQIYISKFIPFLCLHAVGLFASFRIQKKMQWSWIFSILGLTTLARYHISTNADFEFLESANPVLSLQRFFTADEWPFLQNLNAHLLEDNLFGFLYSAINGYHGLDYSAYAFLKELALNSAIVVFIFYLFQGDILYSIASIVLFLGFPKIIPNYFAFALLAPVLLCRLLKRSTLLNYLALIVLCLFLLMWRLDIGTAGLAATVITFIQFQPRFYRKLAPLIGSVVILSILISISIFMIEHNHDIDLLQAVKMTRSFLQSSQSFGYARMDFNATFVSTFHYFIFPFFLCLILGAGFLFQSVEPSSFNISFVFIALFYLFNFQRGLVRHGLIENTDIYSSSFIYLLLMFGFNKWLKFKNAFEFTVGNSAFAFFILLAFSVPSFLQEPNMLQSLDGHLLLPQIVTNYSQRVVRSVETDEIKNRYLPLKQYLDRHLAATETFVDFSDNPMFYFYMNRKVPAFFDQPLLMSHNKFLQDEAIRSFTKLQVNYAITSKNEGSLDGVPNSIRFWWIYQYICENFKPVQEIGDFVIWARSQNAADVKSTFQDFDLKYLPAVIAKYDEQALVHSATSTANPLQKNERDQKVFLTLPHGEAFSGVNAILLKLKETKANTEFTIEYGTESTPLGKLRIRSLDSNELLVPIGSQDAWWLNSSIWISIESEVKANDFEAFALSI